MKFARPTAALATVSVLAAFSVLLVSGLVAAQPVPPQPPPTVAAPAPPPQPAPANQFSSNELVDAGHRFFGGVSRGLATIVEKAVSQWGLPNGYILGEEASGAFVGGLRYGDGTLYTKNAGDLRVFWQGPSIGFDAGADGARTMMLVYNLPRTDAIFERFGGINGSAYFIGGFGMTALVANNITVVPIRSGLGLRLGANVGYLKRHFPNGRRQPSKRWRSEQSRFRLVARRCGVVNLCMALFVSGFAGQDRA
jgi:hypothetical protein